MLSSEDILSETNSIKVLVLIEVEPLSDKFEQLMLTHTQAKAMRDALAKILSPDIDLNKDDQVFSYETNDDIKVVLSDIRDSYDENAFEKED